MEVHSYDALLLVHEMYEIFQYCELSDEVGEWPKRGQWG